MARDDRFYAFIIAHTPRSSARIRRFCVHKRAVRLLAVLGVTLLCAAIYGFYGLTQQAAHLRTENENQRLKVENERQRQELTKLNTRVEAVEDTSRKLAEKSGVISQGTVPTGTGGPAMPLDANSLAALEGKMSQLERNIKAYESVLRERGYTPSIWPVFGKLESAFGGRRNPFGGSSYEFHSGQDIEAALGDPVVAGAKGNVTFEGWQNGYGQSGGNRSRRRAHDSLRTLVSHRCCPGTNGRERPIHWPRGFHRPLYGSPPPLRDSNQRRARESLAVSVDQRR